MILPHSSAYELLTIVFKDTLPITYSTLNFEFWQTFKALELCRVEKKIKEPQRKIHNLRIECFEQRMSIYLVG